MAVNRIIFVFLFSIILLLAVMDARKDAKSRGNLLDSRNAIGPQDYMDFGSDFSNRCDKCGVKGGSQNPNLKIINGTEAEYGEFPWKCFFKIQYENGSISCTCNILSPLWILLAAHCVHDFPVSRMTVSAGIYALNRPDLDNRDTVKVAEYIEHDKWDPVTDFNDIALLRLERPLDFTRPNIEPVCMPYKFKGKTFEWKTATVSGYGLTSSEGTLSAVIRKVDLQVVPIDACINWWQREKQLFNVTENHICAYGMPVSASSFCHGDSGSSLDYMDPANGRYYAIGVVSWGIEPCVTTDLPNIFTDVTKYLDWIDYKTGTHFCS